MDIVEWLRYRIVLDAPEKLDEAADEITRLREEVERLKSEESCNDVLLEYAQAENQRLREENAQLREALKPFAEKAADVAPDDGSIGGCLCAPALLRSYFFNAAAAIREEGRDDP